MDEQAVATDMMRLAKLTARKYLRRDPEADSVAGWGLLRALRDYDGTRSLDGYVMFVVKRECWFYLRHQERKHRSSVELRDELFWECEASYDDTYQEDLLTPLEWKMLAERYELKWPVDVIARRNGYSTHKCRQALKAAISKLECMV